MLIAESHLKPSPRMLRQFAGVWIVLLASLALFCPGSAVLILFILPAVAGLFWPRIVRPVYIAAAILTLPIAWCISWLVIALIYYVVFTPLGLFFRVLRRDALTLRAKPAEATYWIETAPSLESSDYLRQY